MPRAASSRPEPMPPARATRPRAPTCAISPPRSAGCRTASADSQPSTRAKRAMPSRASARRSHATRRRRLAMRVAADRARLVLVLIAAASFAACKVAPRSQTALVDDLDQIEAELRNSDARLAEAGVVVA